MKRMFLFVLSTVMLVAIPAMSAPPWGVGIGVHYVWRPGKPLPKRFAVVDTDIKPRHARLYLDGRFIGYADQFDGSPGYLYLLPGHYTLRCELGGYEPKSIPIEAKGKSLYRIKLKLKRIPGTKKEHRWEQPKRKEPVKRVWGPIKGETAYLRILASPPNAAVFIDGELVGEARRLKEKGIIRVSAGKHRISAVAPGTAEEVKVVKLEPGEVETVSFVLR